MKFTDEQRLIVLMLADIQKGLNIEGQFDPDFIIRAAAWKDEFAIAFEHDMLFDSSDRPASFTFVIDVLDMWSFIEDAVRDLDEEQRGKLEDIAGVWGKNPRFRGFDGNNETELMGHTRLLVKDLGRFEEFEGRDFNSHMPLASRYREMLTVFEPIRSEVLDRKLSVEELGKILAA